MQRFKDIISAPQRDDTFQDCNKVQVNQRHLIDKILARYSSRFTIYREMIQNANDACATEMDIIFYSSPSTKKSATTTSTTTTMIDSIEIRNNGLPFSEGDWSRLTKIAEGNPEEDKIGFFGVGFYSLFSICEHPIVLSNSRILRFLWLKDQLYAVPGNADDSSKDTSIFLELRNSDEEPDWDSFSKFIAKSILFTRNISTIRVFLDEKEVFSFTKELLQDKGINSLIDNDSLPSSSLSSSSSKNPSLISFLTNVSSEQPFFKTESVNLFRVNLLWKKRYRSMDQEVNEDDKKIITKNRSIWDVALLWTTATTKRLFSMSKWDPEHMARGEFSISVKLLKASITSQLPISIKSEMKRVMKKDPPRKSSIEIIINNNDDFSNIHPLLRSILPSPEDDQKGHLFVGFETHQDIGGFYLNIQGPFVPTVERESLDFVDVSIARWNESLLFLLGKYIRLLYQMMIVSVDGTSDTKNSLKIIKYFSPLQQSTPSRLISSKIMETFLSSSPISQLLLPTQIGWLPFSKVRSIPPNFPKQFLDTSTIPLLTRVPSSLTDLFVSSTFSSTDRGGMYVIAPLTIDECLLNCKKDIDGDFSLLFTFLEDELRKGRSSFSANSLLSNKNFISIKYYPSPLLFKYTPPLLLRGGGEYDNSIIWMEERPIFEWLSWKIFDIFDWIAMYLKEISVEGNDEDKDKCINFLNYLSKIYRKEKDEIMWSRISSLIQGHKIIPCQDGSLARPSSVFTRGDDPLIPKDCHTISNSITGIEESFLLTLGLRGHLDLKDFLINYNRGNNVDCSTLLPYLFRIRDQLSKDEIKILKEGKYFPTSSNSKELVQISTLYLPSPLARELGLPTIMEGSSFKKDYNSFLIELGIRERPTLNEILRKINLNIFVLLLKEWERKPYLLEDEHLSIPFIPCKGGTFLFSSIKESFLDDELLLFSSPTIKVVEDDWKWSAKRLWNAREYPTEDVLISILENNLYPPINAPSIFSYLGKINFTKKINCRVPLPSHEEGNFQWFNTKDLFINLPTSSPLMLQVIAEVSFFKECSTFYKDSSSQYFLIDKLGVAERFGLDMLISSLIKEHLRILEKIGAENYKKLLFLIGESSSLCKEEIILISKTPMLLGIHFTKSTSSSTTTSSSSSPSSSILERSYTLAYAKDIYFPDDTLSQSLFDLLIVPDGLSNLYHLIGSKRITEVVSLKYLYSKTEKININHPVLLELENRIRERAPLLLHSLSMGTSITTKEERIDLLNLLREIKILFSKEIQIERSFKEKKDFKRITALYDGGFLLVSGDNYDSFDIGQTLRSRMMITSSSKDGGSSTSILSDSLLFSSFLTEPLDLLRSKGFPVDLLLGVSLKDSTNDYTVKDYGKEYVANDSLDDSLEDQGDQSGSTLSISKNNTSNNSISNTSNTPNTSKNSISNYFSKLFIDTNKAITKTIKKISKTNDIDDQLLRGINNCKSLNQSMITGLNDFQQQKVILQPPSEEDKENRCIFPSQLVLRCMISSKEDDKSYQFPIAFYTTKKGNNTLMDDDLEMPSKNFIKIIRGLELVFGFDKMTSSPLRQSRIHLYLDETPRTIAFNRSGSLFLNLSSWDPKKTLEDSAKFWYMIMCHELAHNHSGEHDIVHGRFMMLYAEKFLGKFIFIFHNK